MRIPRDLKPGDVIVGSDGERYPFIRYDCGLAECKFAIFRMSGVRWTASNGRAVRIERIASKTKAKAAGDKNDVARWCIRRAIGAILSDDVSVRVAAHNDIVAACKNPQRFARRLNGGRMP